MPIAIACKACGTKYNVPDHLAGRSAKCKCGSPIAVPAGAARAMQPAAPRPAPARQAAAEPEIEIGDGDVVETAAPSSLGSFSLDSLDDLGVPPKMQAKIREELKQSEKVLWAGRPLVKYVMKKCWLAFWVGWIILAIGAGAGALIWTSMADKPDVSMGLLLVIMAIPGFFLLFALIFITMPFWYKRLSHYRDVYILTNQRAVTFDYESLVKCTVRSYTAAQMSEFHPTEYGSVPGAGDLNFCTEMVDMGTRVSRHTDRLAGIKTIKYQQQRAPRIRGFLAIENVRQVAALVRQTLFNQAGQRPRR